MNVNMVIEKLQPSAEIPKCVHDKSEDVSSDSDNASERHYADLCVRNNFAWLLTHNSWKSAWNPAHLDDDGYYTTTDGKRMHGEHGDIITDPDGRGFLIHKRDYLRNVLDIHALLVDEDQRRKGVMRALMQRLWKEHEKQESTVPYVMECITREAAQVALALGFELTNHHYDYTTGLYTALFACDHAGAPFGKAVTSHTGEDTE